MARLSQIQARELIQVPANRTEIERAVSHDLRLRFHTEPIEFESDETKAHQNYYSWISKIIGSEQKLERFKQFCTTPLYTNELTDSVFKELHKVFDTSNAYRDYEFDSEELKADWLNYLKRKKDFLFWRTEAYNKLKTSINAFLIVDLPSTQMDSRPEPYWYTIDMDQVIDVEITKQKNIDSESDNDFYFKTEYIIFKDSKGLIIVLDDEFYRVFEEKTIEGKNKEINYELIVENPHDLGYCPAKQLYSDPYTSKDTIRKKGPISVALGMLDLILYNHVAESFGDSYIPFPVITKYREKCNYIEPVTQMECINGMVPEVSEQNPYNPNEPRYKACPICTRSSEVFAGSTVTVDPPESSDQADQIDAVKFVQPSTEGLKYISEKNEDWENKFVYKVVGKGDDFVNGQARNEKDVQSRFESRETILRQIAVNLEAAMDWVYTTSAKLRYGNMFDSAKIFLGDKYFLHSISELNEVYKQQKDNGYPEFQLSLTRNKILQTKYKDDPNTLQKAEFLSLIEPLQGKTLKELMEIKRDDPEAISNRDYDVKINFDSFVKRFEVEVMPINTLLDQVKKESITLEKAILEFNERLTEYTIKEEQ